MPRVTARGLVQGEQPFGDGFAVLEGMPDATCPAFSPDLDPVASHHIVDLLCDLAGVVRTPLQVPGDHQVVHAPGDGGGLFHHAGDPLPEEGMAERIHHVVVNTYIISRIIERIGDHVVRCAEHASRIPKEGLSPETIEAVRKAGGQSLSLFDRSIISFFKADIREPNANIEQVEILEEICREITVHTAELDPGIAVSLRSIAESIRRAGEYAGDISGNVINMLVEEME